MAKGPGSTRSGSSSNPTGVGNNAPVRGIMRSFPNARLAAVDSKKIMDFVNRHGGSVYDLRDGTYAMELGSMPDTSLENANKLEQRLGIEIAAVDRVDNLIRFRYKERGGSRQALSMPSMPKKDTGTRATVRFGEDTYEISHYSTGYGNDKRTNGTFNVAINGRGLTRFDYGPGPYRAYKNAREAYEAIKKFLRKRDSNS